LGITGRYIWHPRCEKYAVTLNHLKMTALNLSSCLCNRISAVAQRH